MVRAVIVLLCVFLISCSSHRFTPLASIDDSKLTKTCTKKDVKIDVLDLGKIKGDRHKIYRKISKSGFLPIQIKISNNSNAYWRVPVSQIKIFTSNGELRQFDPNKVSEEVGESYAEVFAWTTAFGVIGMFGSFSNVADTNISIKDDIESKILKSGVLSPGETTEGVLFFCNKHKINSEKFVLQIVLKDKENNDTMVCSVSNF